MNFQELEELNQYYRSLKGVENQRTLEELCNDLLQRLAENGFCMLLHMYDKTVEELVKYLSQKALSLETKNKLLNKFKYQTEYIAANAKTKKEAKSYITQRDRDLKELRRLAWTLPSKSLQNIYVDLTKTV